MPNNGFKVETEVENTLLLIEEDIKEIASIIENTFNAMKTLDQRKWQGKEKDKIDNQYIPYLEKLNNNTSLYLTSFVTKIREGIILHQETEAENKQVANEIVDII